MACIFSVRSGQEAGIISVVVLEYLVRYPADQLGHVRLTDPASKFELRMSVRSHSSPYVSNVALQLMLMCGLKGVLMVFNMLAEDNYKGRR